MSAMQGIRLKNPAHPGGFIKSEIVEALGLTVTAAAQVLGVTRAALSSLLNERSHLSSEMALRIEKAFGVSMDTLGSTGEEDGCQHHADGCQRKGGPGGQPEGLDGGAKAGIKQDDGQHERAQHIGQRIVAEMNAKPISASSKADHEEKKQQRSAETIGDETGKCGNENEDGGDQQQYIK